MNALQHTQRIPVGIATLLASLALLVGAWGADTAQAKVISGELQCAPGERVSGIWLLGSRSGWHGFNYPSNKRPYTGWYSINAVSGETIQHWIRCSVFGESYGSFRVGSGSTRHICAKGWRCASTNVGKCGVMAAFGGLNIRVLACLIRYGR